MFPLACVPAVDTADGGFSGPIRVGANGGIFVRDGLGLNIPKGALDSDNVFNVSVVDQGIPDADGRKRVSYGFQITPKTLIFKKPITLYVPALAERVPAGLMAQSFDLRRQWGSDSPGALPGTRSQDDPLLVSGPTDRLGLFWITSPAEPAAKKIKVTPVSALLIPGGTQAFSADLLDTSGIPISGVKLTWSVAPARVATVDNQGNLTALAPGLALMTVSVGDLNVDIPIRVKGNAVGPQTFEHELPFPTGNDLFGGTLYGGNALFVGQNGTALVRSPSDQWTRVYSSPLLNFQAAAGNSVSAVAVGTQVGATTQGVVVEFSSANPSSPKVFSFSTCQPRAIWFDGTWGMAVGVGNDVAIRQNGSWVKSDSPSFETLLSVVGDGNGAFVTLGDLGSLYRYNPLTQVWDSLFQTQLGVLLTAGVVAQANGSEAWAAGGNQLWHFSSGGWTAIDLPASLPALSSISALGIMDGRVVMGGAQSNGQGQLFLYRLSDSSWTSQPLRSQQQVRGIFGAGSEGYAVGTSGAVWAYQTGTFLEKSAGDSGDVVSLSSVAGTTVAAQNNCQDLACTQLLGNVIRRTSPGVWESVGTPVPWNGPLTAVAARAASEIYAASPSALYLYDGSHWSNIYSVGAAISSLAFCRSNLWAADQSGTLAMGQGSPAQNFSSVGTFNPALKSLFCAQDGKLWEAGSYALYEDQVARNTAGQSHAPWNTVWSPAAGEAYVFGHATYGLVWNTQKLFAVQSFGGVLPEEITTSWGDRPDRAYFLGYSAVPTTHGFALRFDGSQFTPVDLGTQKFPLAVAGTDSSNLWIGTRGGGILRAVSP